MGSNSGVVKGINPGAATIIYTLPTTCFVTYPVNITTPPTAIFGPSTVCHDYAITLTDGTTPGTWSVSPGSGTANISSGGVLTGLNTGVVIVSYATLACNPVTAPIQVNPLPDPITGIGNLCVGSGTSLTDATIGGTWSSSNSTATVSNTGVVSGVDTGSATYISYTLPTGCYVYVWRSYSLFLPLSWALIVYAPAHPLFYQMRHLMGLEQQRWHHSHIYSIYRCNRR